MTEYIRKQDAFDAVNHALDRETILFSFVRKVAISALKGLHAADVVPVVHSQWKYKCGEIQCPECGNRIHRIDLSGYLNFCPNCGAKMDREE